MTEEGGLGAGGGEVVLLHGVGRRGVRDCLPYPTRPRRGDKARYQGLAGVRTPMFRGLNPRPADAGSSRLGMSPEYLSQSPLQSVTLAFPATPPPQFFGGSIVPLPY